MDDIQKDSKDKSKVIRLVDYLTRLASLRTKTIRTVGEYQNVLWIKDVPRHKGCFTQAWERDEDDDYDPDIWIEIQNRLEPDLPSVPDQCKDWIEMASLRDKNDIPDLLPEITKQVKNPAWQKESDQPEFLTRTERLVDNPEVQGAWERYVDDRWFPWLKVHNDWESIHKVYSKLFAIHQEQLRLGEEYELVLALGLLTWKTPSSQRISRHLIVANAVLEFEARLGKFTVRPLPAGAHVRPELDMLDIEEQPARAEETATSSLVNVADDPWEKDCVEGVLQALVHSIHSQGEYDSTLEAKRVRVPDKPIIEYAPALILRKRSARGLTETLKRIKERIKEGGKIPGEFGDLAEIRSGSNVDSENDPGETNSCFDNEIFFPKPSNEEQRRIVDKIRVASGVLVQGPPGTGKSHTIANLICHLLATGQRTLITAKTPRALEILEELVPEELRPLCINLLGSGLKEKRSLESSIGGILRKNEEWNESRATKERENLEQKLRKLREEKVKIDRRLRDIRESETHSQSIAEGTYRGTAARIAEVLNRYRPAYEWFTDKAPLEKTCPISESDLRNVLVALRRFTPEKRRDLSLSWPDVLPSPDRLLYLVEREKRAIEDERGSEKRADVQIANHLSKIDVATIEAIREALSAFQGERRRYSASPHPWMRDALRDVIGGNPSLWQELSRVTRDVIDSIEPLVAIADDTSLNFPDDTNVRSLLEDVCKLKEHVQNGGKLGWGLFRPKIVKERLYVLKEIQVNGRPCSTLEHLSVLADALRVRFECEKAWGFWVDRCKKTQGPYALQLSTLKAQCDALEHALSLEGLIEKCRDTLQHCPPLNEPVWTDESQIERLIASCVLALARHRKSLVVGEIRNIEAPLEAIVAGSNAHPKTSELLQTIRNRDIDGFTRVRNELMDLERERQSVQKVDEDIEKLNQIVPRLTKKLKYTCNDSCWEARIHQIQAAWHWAQARLWIEEYIREEDTPSLAKRVRQIEDEINSTTAKLALIHAWSFCFSRLKENHRRHMEAWQQSMRRLGKGTGKHAPRHRREAQ